MGDVYDFVSELINRARKEGGQVYLALYELSDPQLIKLLVDAMKSKLIHIILTTAGNFNPNPRRRSAEESHESEETAGRLGHRERRSASAASQGRRCARKDRVIDRMFNSSARIGHNKLAVYVKGDKPTRRHDRQHQLDRNRPVRTVEQLHHRRG